MLLILTTPRTASNYFCRLLANEYNYENLYEYFGAEDLSTIDQYKKIEYLTNNPNTIVKAFPWHLEHNVFANFSPRVPQLSKLLINNAEKVIFLLRKDFYSQCKSYFISWQSDHWNGDPRDAEHITFDAKLYQKATDVLVEGYNILYEYSKSCADFEIRYTEDLENDGKYIRPVTWSEVPPIPNFNPTNLFKG